jgi:hypothetical protein
LVLLLEQSVPSLKRLLFGLRIHVCLVEKSRVARNGILFSIFEQKTLLCKSTLNFSRLLRCSLSVFEVKKAIDMSVLLVERFVLQGD